MCSGCAACILHFACNAWYVVGFNRENESFSPAFFPDGASGGALAGIIYDFRYRGNPVYIHFPSYYITWSRGIAATKIVDYRFGAVRRKRGGTQLPRYLEWAGRFGNYDGRYRNLDLILTRGETVRGDLGVFVETKWAGAWALHRRTNREND